MTLLIVGAFVLAHLCRAFSALRPSLFSDLTLASMRVLHCSLNSAWCFLKQSDKLGFLQTLTEFLPFLFAFSLGEGTGWDKQNNEQHD